MKRKIALVGAFDRNNYGDILMPIIFDRYYKQKFPELFSLYDFEFYGLCDADMTKYGGYNTRPLSEIYSNKKIDYAIVVGGDTLPCRYGNMYIHLTNNSHKVKRYMFYDKFLRIIFERYSKIKLNCKHVKPWILNLEKFNIKTIYNTVGGLLTTRKLLFNRKKIINTLKNSTYLSVRDAGTKKCLDNINVKNNLYPDSVILLSKVITTDDYEKNVNLELKSTLNNYGKYFILQVSEAASKGLIDTISEQIEEMYKKNGLKCILLPIGRASGHSDQIPLKQIEKKVTTPIYIPDETNVFETAYIIKNSQFFCGTSLHGVITSISYGIPHMALTNKIGKLIRFMETWNTSPITFTSSKEIEKNYELLNSKKNLVEFTENKRKELIALAEKNFENIYESIK